jgi:hypothetical protein
MAKVAKAKLRTGKVVKAKDGEVLERGTTYGSKTDCQEILKGTLPLAPYTMEYGYTVDEEDDYYYIVWDPEVNEWGEVSP